MKHQINFKEMNFPLYNSKLTYSRDKASVTIESCRESHAKLFGVDWMALHLAYKICKGFTVGAKAKRCLLDWEDHQLEVGAEWDLGNKGKIKMKDDLEANTWTSFSFQLNDKASMVMTAQRNRNNYGEMYPGWKGYLGLPFNFGVKLKLEC